MESEERETKVAREDLMTPLEHQLFGSTPEEGEFPVNVPLGISTKRYSNNEISEARKSTGFVKTDILAWSLGYKQQTLAISLEEIDLQTGELKNPPRFLGFWDSEEDKIIEQGGLNEEVWNKIRNWNKTHQKELIEEKYLPSEH